MLSEEELNKKIKKLLEREKELNNSLKLEKDNAVRLTKEIQDNNMEKADLNKQLNDLFEESEKEITECKQKNKQGK